MKKKISKLNQITVMIVASAKSKPDKMQNWLHSAGYHTQTYPDIEHICQPPFFPDPHLIIIIQNCSIDPIKFKVQMKQIKKIKQFHSIPVLLVIYKINPEMLKQLLNSRVDGYIEYPKSSADFLSHIRLLLKIKELQTVLDQKTIGFQKVKTRLQKLAITDGLTGIYNYRYFKQQLDIEISRAKRYGQPFSIMMIDIDNFKQFNDHHGHLAGNQILRKVSYLLHENIRKVDLLARYGGEEFVLILPGTKKSDTITVAEKLRSLIDQCYFSTAKIQSRIKISISIGIASFPEDAENDEDLIRISDQELYRAKQSGRNCVSYII